MNGKNKIKALVLCTLLILVFPCLEAMAYDDKIESFDIVDIDSDSIRCMLRLSYTSQYGLDSLYLQKVESDSYRAELYFKESLPLLDRWSDENYHLFSLPYDCFSLLHLRLFRSRVDYSTYSTWIRGEGDVSYNDYSPWYSRDIVMPHSLGTIPVPSYSLSDDVEENISLSLDGGVLHIKGSLYVNSDEDPYVSYQVFDDSVIISRSGKCFPRYNEFTRKLECPPCQAKLYHIDLSIPDCTSSLYNVRLNGINGEPSKSFRVDDTINNMDIKFVQVVAPVEASFYDMLGRPVTHPTSGIYIQNGRKVLAR